MEDLWAMPENGLFEPHRGKLRKLPHLTDRHQAVRTEILCQFTPHLRKQHAFCLINPYFVMPFAAPETPYTAIDTVLQPDFCAILDRSKIGTVGCLGAPDLVAEVVSQGAEDMDFGEKLDLYEAAGVRKYWITDPYRQELTVCTLEHGKYRRQGYRSGNVPRYHLPALGNRPGCRLWRLGGGLNGVSSRKRSFGARPWRCVVRRWRRCMEVPRLIGT